MACNKLTYLPKSVWCFIVSTLSVLLYVSLSWPFSFNYMQSCLDPLSTILTVLVNEMIKRVLGLSCPIIVNGKAKIRHSLRYCFFVFFVFLRPHTPRPRPPPEVLWLDIILLVLFDSNEIIEFFFFPRSPFLGQPQFHQFSGVAWCIILGWPVSVRGIVDKRSKCLSPQWNAKWY